MRKVLVQGLGGMLALVATLAMQAAAVAQGGAKKHVTIEVSKLQEADAATPIGEPNYGYAGELGAFSVMSAGGQGMIVVHNYPDTTKNALAATELSYVGPKRVGKVDGWVFKTQWDGKTYPSRIFFSADEVYFGGGVSAFIVADYRDGTGWVWKMLPMRRMQLLQK